MNIHTLGTPKPGKYDPNLAERLNKEAEEEARAEEARKKPDIAAQDTENPEAQEQTAGLPEQDKHTFDLVDLPDSYSFRGVRLPNCVTRVDLEKVLLLDRKPRTADQWHEYSDRALSKGNFYMASLPTLCALAVELYTNRDGPHKPLIEFAKALLERPLREGVWTSTRVKSHQTFDKVMHSYQYAADCREVFAIVRGPEEWLSHPHRTAVCSVLLEQDPQTAYDAFKWLTNYDAIIQPHNATNGCIEPILITGTPTRLYIKSSPSDSLHPAFGVRLYRQ
ncbi:hypothetical protein HY642_03775 [Candidatus Woesearchaeota archaeon]|nr:hypothetical protein [Candidatus Woesearchaeota archaeon]